MKRRVMLVLTHKEAETMKTGMLLLMAMFRGGAVRVYQKAPRRMRRHLSTINRKLVMACSAATRGG